MTIFTTPVLTIVLRCLARIFLAITGWRIKGKLADLNKYVIIVAPHTSNWDFPLGLACGFVAQANPHWLGKQELFQGPFRAFFLYLGGIPIDRSGSHNVVDQMIDLLKKRDQFVLALSPEGTRSYVDRWKSGFYYMAHGAGVPILCISLDRSRKIWDFGQLFYTTGEYENDLVRLKEMYSEVIARNPSDQSV